MESASPNDPQLEDEEQIQRGIHRDVGKAPDHGEAAPVLDKEEGRQLIAQHQRQNADGLAQQILIQQGPHHLVPGEKACDVKGPHQGEDRGEEEGYKPGEAHAHAKDVLHLFPVVLAHVLAAEDGCAAGEHQAHSAHQHAQRAEEAHRAHSLHADIIAGKIAGDEAVDGADHAQHHLNGQQAKHELSDHPRVGRLGRFFNRVFHWYALFLYAGAIY